jgi:hypothetical protein
VKWTTRANIHIDRAACAWLIRRDLDPDAEFVFLTDPTQIPTDATPFDLRGVELSHHNGDCSFETILRRYELTDPVLWRIAEIIHEADLDDERYELWPSGGLASSSSSRPQHDQGRSASASRDILELGGEGGRRWALPGRAQRGLSLDVAK